MTGPRLEIGWPDGPLDDWTWTGLDHEMLTRLDVCYGLDLEEEDKEE